MHNLTSAIFLLQYFLFFYFFIFIIFIIEILKNVFLGEKYSLYKYTSRSLGLYNKIVLIYRYSTESYNSSPSTCRVFWPQEHVVFTKSLKLGSTKYGFRLC